MRTAALVHVVIAAAATLVALPASAEQPAKAKNPSSDDVAVKGALARETALVDLSRADSNAPTTTVVKTASGGVPVVTTTGTERSQDTGARASHMAGMSPMAAPATAAVERPVAGPRVLQRMDASRVLASVDPTMRACAMKAPNSAAATLSIRLSVTPTGDVERAEAADRSVAREDVVACVLSTVSAAKFRAPGPTGASMLVPVQLPATKATAVIVTPAMGFSAVPAPPVDVVPRGAQPPASAPSQPTNNTTGA